VIRLFNHYLNRRVLYQVLFDFGLIVALMTGVVVMFFEGVKEPGSLVSLSAAHGVSLAAFVFVINTASGFYRPAVHRSLSQSCARAALASLFALPLAYAIARMLPSENSGNAPMTWAAMVGVVGVILHRVYAAHSASASRARSRVLILGTGPAADAVSRTLRASDPSVEVVGYLRSPNERQVVVPESQVFDAHHSLAETARQSHVNEVVVALTERRGGSMPMRELLDCKIQGVTVCDLATHFEKTLGQIRLDYVNAGWLIFGDGFNQGMVRTAMKRVFDVACALILLVLSLPVMLLTALMVSLESKGPVFYSQERVGFNGRTFRVVKFRSMRSDAEVDGKPRWAQAGDDRITRVGRVIRKLRIDELPQLFNVLKGEMSLVGPRPERPFFVDQLVKDIPYYAVRHSVKPGLTGWAQVRYHYGSTVADSQQKLQYDLYYVKNHTLFLDMLILFETVAVVLTGKGAH